MNLKLVKKLFSFSIGSVIGLFISLLSAPIITRIVDPSEFGIASIFMTVGSVLGIIALAGLDQAFVRFFYATDRMVLLRKCIILCAVSTGGCIALIFSFGDILSSYISPDANYVVLMILNVIVMAGFRFSLLILRMLQFGYRYSIIQILQRLLDLLFVLSFVFIFSQDRYALIFGSIVTAFILTIVTLFLSRSFWKTDGAEMEQTNSKVLLAYSLPLLLATLMAVLFQTLDKLFLNAWVTSTEFGIYAAAFKLVAILNVIQTSFTLFWAPASLEHYEKHPNDKEFYSRISKMITVSMVALCIFVVMAKDVLVLFLGPAYHEASSVIALLVLMPVLYTMSETTVQGIIFSLKSKLHIVTSAIALTVNIILCWLLIPIFGMEGAGLSIAFSYVVFYLARTYYGMKYFRFDTKFPQTCLLIASLLVWIILVVFTGSQAISLIGGAAVLMLLSVLFWEEIRAYSMSVKLLLKRN